MTALPLSVSGGGRVRRRDIDAARLNTTHRRRRDPAIGRSLPAARKRRWGTSIDGDDAEITDHALHLAALRGGIDHAGRSTAIAERGHGDVLAQRQVGQDALVLPFVGKQGDFRGDRIAWVAQRDRLSVLLKRAAVGAQIAAEDAGDLVLASAEQAGQRDDLAPAHVKRDAAHAVPKAEIVGCERGLGRRPRRRRIAGLRRSWRL